MDGGNYCDDYPSMCLLVRSDVIPAIGELVHFLSFIVGY
jgi:hypothetical protein